MYRFLRPFLFRLDPERAHLLTLRALALTGAFSPAGWLVSSLLAAPEKPVRAAGLTFRNPIGLAAGYDKDAGAWRGLARLGFGHLEIGTVTPRPQPGNPRPRVFRLPEDRALINRLGFPGKGAAVVAARLQGPRPTGTRVGVNLGKNKDTPNERAAEDYLQLLATFAPLADYLAINVSSPNTIGLRRLQARSALEDLLRAVRRARTDYRPVPIFVKLAPDLDGQELEDAVGAVMEAGMDGIIAANTTVNREGLRSPQAAEIGGLSGAPLSHRSFEMLRQVVRLVDGALPIVSVGGIMEPDDARRRLDSGATLVQVYTGLVYAGPGLVRRMAAAL